MNYNKIFQLNPLDSELNIIQVYGLINGVCWKRYLDGRNSYRFEIQFFNKKKQLIKISNHVNDGTIVSFSDLATRIQNTYLLELES